LLYIPLYFTNNLWYHQLQEEEMPYIKIQTNAISENPDTLLKKLSTDMAHAIGKPEGYIMTAFEPVKNMTFAGTDEPAAYIECKSIGLTPSQTGGLSAMLCGFCHDHLKIPQNRVYIEFADAPGAMWGWDGGTF
jgi:phenylpyruvate tautomerase